MATINFPNSPSQGQEYSAGDMTWVYDSVAGWEVKQGAVSQVDGGAGLTGSITSSGALDVGAGVGITVNPDDVEIDRTTVDGWYAAASHNQAWGTITGTPTTLAGYGITDAATSAQGDKADTALQPGDGLGSFDDVTLTGPSNGQILSYNGSEWVNAAAPATGVTQVDGGAGLTGSVTDAGALNVGAGTGITVNADDIEVDRTTVDTWYATSAQGALADTALQSGDGLESFDDVTLTGPSNGQILSYNGSQWVNAAPPATGVTQVDGGAGLTGSVTTSGALDVGAGTGVTVNTDDIEIDRTVVDTWYAASSHSQAWSTITSTPTTLVGYGITDAATSAQGDKADEAVPTVPQAPATAIQNAVLITSADYNGITPDANTLYFVRP